MELEQLRTRARAMLATARQDLRKTKNVQPTVLLLDPIDCSGERVVLIEGEIMDDPRQKAALGDRVRAMSDEHGYTACIFVSDVWSPGEIDPAQAAKIEAVQSLYRCTLEKACKLLTIPLYEMINVEVQTLGPCVSLRQTYLARLARPCDRV